MENERFTIEDAKDFARKGKTPLARVLANQLAWEMERKEELACCLQKFVALTERDPVRNDDHTFQSDVFAATEEARAAINKLTM